MFMKVLFIIMIVLGALGIVEGGIYYSPASPMGYAPDRGTGILLIGVFFVVAGIAGLIIGVRKRRALIHKA